MPRMTGKQALMEMLRAEGVEYIFGNPGTSESAIMDALEGYPDLKYALTLQEGVAMGMADSYARATGRPSFVNLHIETGLANGISLLSNASAGGTPLVLSAGNKDIRELAHGRSDLAAMVGSMCINGTVVGTGHGRDVINGHPLEALVWLANAEAARGRDIPVDWIVMLGSVVQTKWVARGDVVQVHIDGLGSACARFL